MYIWNKKPGEDENSTRYRRGWIALYTLSLVILAFYLWGAMS